jgi:hypothetical protein
MLLAGMMTAAMIAPAVASASPATVTQATLPSFFVDLEGTFFPATCDVTQVVNDQQRIETFRCTFDDTVPAPYVCHKTCTWASDFDGAPAQKTHFLITPSGEMHGWAIY